MARLREFYDCYYPPTQQPPTAPNSPKDSSLPTFNALLDLDADDDEDIVDELSDYLAQPRAKYTVEGELLDWWIARQQRYPRLFRMAIDLLTIPAMSSENERSFSQAKLVITSQKQVLRQSNNVP